MNNNEKKLLEKVKVGEALTVEEVLAYEKLIANQPKTTLGKYATLAKNYLMEHKKDKYLTLVLNDQLGTYLMNIDKQAKEIKDTMYENFSKLSENQNTNNFVDRYNQELEKQKIVEETILNTLVYV